MFDIGFWEITVIMVVALIVIGPERLPKVARTMGLWVSRIRRMVQSVKADIDRELHTEEFKSLTDTQNLAPELEELKNDLSSTISPNEPAPAIPKKSPSAPKEKSSDQATADNKT